MIQGAGSWAAVSVDNEEAARRFDRLDQFFDRVSQIAVDLDRRGRVRYINGAGARLLGYDQSELMNVDWFERVLPIRIRNEVRAVFYSLMSGDESTNGHYENAVKHKDGREVVVRWQNSVVRDRQGQIDGTFSVGDAVSMPISNGNGAYPGAAGIYQKLQDLTAREYEVMALMIAGRRTKEIALDLGVSVKTIETHRTRVMTKMQANTPVELIRSIVSSAGHPLPEDCIPQSHQELRQTKKPNGHEENGCRETASGKPLRVSRVGSLA